MDNLEQFITKNREDLDKHEPSKNIWRGIKASLKTRKPLIPSWLAIAAIVTIIFGSAIVLFSLSQKKTTSYAEGKPDQPILNETEVYYNALVNALYLKAKPFLTGQPEIAMELRTDMAQLDSICADIKKDLKDNVANQEVIEALIQNYRIKLQLLEDMLNLLNQNENKSEKNKSHEL